MEELRQQAGQEGRKLTRTAGRDGRPPGPGGAPHSPRPPRNDGRAAKGQQLTCHRHIAPRSQVNLALLFTENNDKGSIEHVQLMLLDGQLRVRDNLRLVVPDHNSMAQRLVL